MAILNFPIEAAFEEEGLAANRSDRIVCLYCFVYRASLRDRETLLVLFSSSKDTTAAHRFDLVISGNLVRDDALVGSSCLEPSGSSGVCSPWYGRYEYEGTVALVALVMPWQAAGYPLVRAPSCSACLLELTADESMADYDG